MIGSSLVVLEQMIRRRMAGARRSRRILGGGLILAWAAASPLAAGDTARTRTPAVVSQIPPGETVHFDDLDLDGFTHGDLEALADVTIVGAPDCAAPVDDPPPRTQAWDERDKANRFCAMEGELDLLRNPTIAEANRAVQAERAAIDPDAGTFSGDPFREPLTRWNRLRGRYDSIRYTGPDGAVRHAAMFRPLEACTESRRSSRCPAGLPRPSGPPYPGVILICHICSPGSAEAADPYIWVAETLAEAGYMVLTAPTPAELALDFFVATPREPTAQGEANPFWTELDSTRVGLTGHSGAGSMALAVGQADARVTAVVSLDRSRSFDTRQLEITTPAMLLTGDADYFFLDEDFQPVREPLDPPALGTKWADLELFRAAEVPAMLVSLRAGAHGEPFRPIGTCLLCSRHGQRVMAYYTLAWFDRYLKGRGDPWMARDALARLTARTFDGSADASAIDMGTFDPAAGNVPVTIAGMPVVDRLSFYRTSGYWLGQGRGLQCEDLRSGLRSGECHSYSRPGPRRPPRIRIPVRPTGTARR
jgi:dienelactone hydrolase